MNKLVGQQIDQYRIITFLAKGGMAEVYIAQDVDLDREVILKIMFPWLAKDATFAARFRREAQLTAQLNHPHIVRVYSIGITLEERPYLAMQYIRGGSLHDYLKTLADQGKRISSNDALSIVIQIADGLHAAHQLGIVHRDLKPSNILLHLDGTATLTDLGIAAVPANTTRLTQTGNLVGTPTYMSPEQAKGNSVDGRSDIYALGIILFQLLAGNVPFTADTPIAVLYQHVNDPPPTLQESRPDLPSHILQAVTICLQKEPSHRFQNANALKMALQGKITKQTVPPLPTRSAQTKRRWQRWWLMLPILLLLGGFTISQLRRPPEVAESTRQVSRIESIPVATKAVEIIPTPESTSQIVLLSTTAVTPSPSPTDLPPTAISPSPAPQPSQTPLPAITTASVNAYWINTPPIIDGNLDDWPTINSIASAHVVYQDSNWNGEDDVNAHWILGWDSANLYMVVIVIDDIHVQIQSDVSIYKGDSVELQFDTDLAGDVGTTLSSDDFQLLLSPGDFNAVPQAVYLWQGRAGQPQAIVPNHQIVMHAVATADGYLIEASIPWQDLSLVPAPELTIGLALNVSDNDVAGTAVQEILKSNVASRAFLSPQSWGTLRLQP